MSSLDKLNIQHKINEILATRKPLVEGITAVLEQVQDIENIVSDIISYSSKEDSNLTDEQQASISALPIEDFLKKTAYIKQDLNTLQARFHRNTLNIGVIGRARQGKSRLLQSLTGLSRREIPDADGTHCTGVRSSICHQPGIETYAEVYFYNESNFLKEVIAPYFYELSIGSPPKSINEFKTKSLVLNENVKSAVDLSKLEHLKKYQSLLDDYSALLSQKSPLRISKEDIPKYITQYDLDDSTIAYANYLAVREVQIFCSFPDENVGKIAVVDMPGLGDTGIGDEDRLVKTLGQDIDFILFVRMPKQTGDYWADVDVKLYDIANRALQGTSLETWSFQIINELADGSNQRNCRDLQESIANYHLKVAQSIVVNCADSEAVQNAVLPSALEHIAKYIKMLDQRFIQSSEQSLIDLKDSLSNLEKQASITVGISSGTENSAFNHLFKDFWKKMVLNLEKLRIELWNHRQQKDPNLAEALERAIAEAKADTGIPDIEEIREKAMLMGDLNKPYYTLLDTVRVTLTEKFQSQIDNNLKISIDEVKNKIAGIFAYAGLQSLTEQSGPQLLQEICKLIEQSADYRTDSGMQKIHCGFTDLVTFELYYRGLAQPRIRKHLDYLIAPSEGIAREQCAPDLGPNPTSETIAEILHTLHSEALYKISEELEDLLWEPSMSALAITEEFVDSVLRAEDIETSWRNFLWEHREKIWMNQFSWRHLITKLSEYLKPKNLTLI